MNCRLALSVSIVLLLLPVASSRGQIFVSNYAHDIGGGGTVGEYSQSGGGNSIVTSLTAPTGIALSGGKLFVANQGSGTIGEYNASGSAINTSLISGFGLADGIAISGSNLFVVDLLAGTVGLYTTSGGVINPTLISGLNHPTGIAVWGDDLFVASNTDGTIAKYTTSGTLENAVLVSGLGSPEGIAVSGSDLYVVNRGSESVGKYTTSGATVNSSLIPTARLAYGSLSTPRGIVVAGSKLYVTSAGGPTPDSAAVGVYTTSGATVNSTLISGQALNDPWGIAVPRTIGDIETLFPPFNGPAATIDSNAVVTAVLSRPGTVNGFTNTNYAFLVQDTTGSLQIFGSLAGTGYTPTVGDVISATGSYSLFGQDPELGSITEIIKTSSGNPAPDPIVATIPDLNHATIALGAPALPAVGEYLFTLNNVTISGEAGPNWGNGATGGAANQSLTITDAGGHSMNLFYWPTSYSTDAAFYGSPIPTGPVNMTGFVSALGTVEFIPTSITPVPEPGSLAILAVGGAWVFMRRRAGSAEARKFVHF